jgi:hypothetical protein
LVGNIKALSSKDPVIIACILKPGFIDCIHSELMEYLKSLLWATSFVES